MKRNFTSLMLFSAAVAVFGNTDIKAGTAFELNSLAAGDIKGPVAAVPPPGPVPASFDYQDEVNKLCAIIGEPAERLKCSSPGHNKDMFSQYRNFGMAAMGGGYENFVAAGRTTSGDRVLFGGGDHASGDLGFTFPWALDRNGELSGAGFNDMNVMIGTRLFSYKRPFEKFPVNGAVPEVRRGMNIRRNGLGAIEKISVEEFMNERPADNGAGDARSAQNAEGGSVKVRFELYVRQGGVVRRDEAFKRINGALPGEVMTEQMLMLDPGKESFIEITRGGGSETYLLASLTGSIEKGVVDMMAFKSKHLRIHMQYDYAALYPVDAGKCGNEGIVAYISGLLNRDQGLVQKQTAFMVKELASSAFTADFYGKDKPIHRIQDYDRIKNIGDILKIRELSFERGIEFPGQMINLVVGTFNRRLIELERGDGCVFGGMLETQTLNR